MAKITIIIEEEEKPGKPGESMTRVSNRKDTFIGYTTSGKYDSTLAKIQAFIAELKEGGEVV